MKIFLFYIIDKEDIIEENYPAIIDDHVRMHEDGYFSCLYAWTNKKSLKEEFEITHNSNISMKEVYMDEDKFNSFSLEYSELELKIQELIRGCFNNDIEEVDTVKVVTTDREYEIILLYPTEALQRVWDNYDYMKNFFILYNHKVFNNQIMYLLKNYFFIEDSLIGYISEEDNKLFNDDILFNQFEIYIELYKNLLRG